MMKRLWMIAACAAMVVPQWVAAQVEKQVEVTKAYVPRVESAAKLAIEPDMNDTTRMRPEIGYTVTPLSLRTTLTTRPIRPATVTYWEFNRPQPFYLKVGAGYPLNSVLDFYATTQNPSTGYAMAYVNHAGYYAKIANPFGGKHNSTRMYNRAGIAAGKYIGRHTLEGELSYDNRMYHRYGVWVPSVPELAFGAGAMTDYGDARLQLRFGDDFQDLSRLNFEVGLHGGLFFDHSDLPVPDMSGRESSIGADGRIAWAWGRSRFGVSIAYDYLGGHKYLEGSNQQLIRAGVRYGFDGGVVRLDAGADYYRDRVGTTALADYERGNYLIPYLRLNFNLGTPGLQPFVEADGGVHPNDLRSLTEQNPYVRSSQWPSDAFLTTSDQPQGKSLFPIYDESSLWLAKSSVDYNFRLGLGGSLWHSIVAYRLYAGFSIHDNHLFWTGWQVARPDTGCDVLFLPVQARQTVTSLNGEIEIRPLSSLKIDLGAHCRLYNDETDLKNGDPAFAGNAGIVYEGRRIAFGVEALFESARSWSVYRYTLQSAGVDGSTWETSGTLEKETLDPFRTPFGVDLRAHFDWHVSGRVTLFAEGRNLLNRKLYNEAWFPEPGARFTVGIKANF